jgi:hypothetical protein
VSVIEFKRPEKHESWGQGLAICIGCRHEWHQVAPVGDFQFDCPSCGSNKGIFKYPFGAHVGDSVFKCNCGCEALTAYMHKGKFWLRCMNCGVDQTEAIFA